MGGPTSTVADRIVARLRAAGVTHLFGVPGGGSNLDLIAAAARAGLPFVLTATETGAALAAVAQAEIARAPGACLTTLGPGAASAANGVACATLDRAPLLVFTDSHPAAASGCTHQRIDHHALFAPMTVWSASLTGKCPERIVDEAIARALRAPGGAVHLDCPGDALSASAQECGARQPPASAASTSTDADDTPRWTDDALAIVRQARRPLVVAGVGARGAASAIRRLCQQHGVPALVTYKAKGVVPDTSPWFGGVFTNAVLERATVEQADVILAVGLDPVELIPRPWPCAAPVLSCAASRYPASQVPFRDQWVGDIEQGLSAIATTLRRSAWDEASVRASVDAARARAFPPDEAFTAERVVAITAGRLARHSRVAVDAGAHMFAATMLWPVDEPYRMLVSNGLSTMGFALPAAIGAALLDREHPVVALTGDGGLMICLAELATAAREHLRVIVVVFADQRLSLIDVKQQQRGLAGGGVRLGEVCWATLAEGLGAAGFRADTDDQLRRALDAAAAHDGPSLVEARIDPHSYRRTLAAIRG